MKRKAVSGIFLMLLLIGSLCLAVICPADGGGADLEVVLFRTPQDVHSSQAALVFAYVSGVFNDVRLNTSITLDLSKDGVSLPGFPYTTREIPLPMIPVPWSSGWYVTSIPGLPAKTIIEVTPDHPQPPPQPPSFITWKVSTVVSYRLVVDEVEVASDSYSVLEGDVNMKLPPLVIASVYDVLEDRRLVEENFGLAPRGWKTNANEVLKALIWTMDDVGIQDVTFEYSVSGGYWNTVTPIRDSLMDPLEELIGTLNKIIDAINNVLGFPAVPHSLASIKIFNAKIPGQSAGNYVMFRANATDVDGNKATSPLGLYYVVNEASNVRLLIIDPHVKLWLLQENVEQLLKALKDHSSYQVPSSITGNVTLISRLADLIEKYGVVPFHHWELLGKQYNLYIAWPDEKIVELLKSEAEGGFEPSVVYLSNLWLGFNITGEVGPWNWDLKEIRAEGKSVLEHLINYVKGKHAGVIASHGTLSDWIVWAGSEPSAHYKVGCRGHVGESPSDLNPLSERTVAALLGMPELSLWEYARDSVAYTLCADPYTEPLGMIAGSIPLQVPYVPFNGTMRLTYEAKYIGWELPDEFTMVIPSVYNEFGFNAYSEVGWQLAMPRALAYAAWLKANETRPLVKQLYSKLSGLVENATSKMVSRGNATTLMDESLNWGLSQFYRSMINASIAGNTFNITLRLPGLNETLRLSVDIGRDAYEKLLQVLPVKLVALSKDGLSAIITHDKYWDQNGYRAVYFAFEAEAADGEIAEKLLTQAVNWTLQWSFKNITELLGNLVRVPKNMAESFKGKLNELPGNVTFSDGLILVEEGDVTVTVVASKAGFLHVVVAHPTSDKVNVTLDGKAEISQIVNVTRGVTYITLKVYAAGLVKLNINVDPESSLNPAYLSIKQEADTTPPSIDTPIQEPQVDNVQPEQAVTVSVNVTDKQMGVREVILSYSTDKGVAWSNVTMSTVDGEVYVGQIPGFPAGTYVQYKIIAYDNAGNYKVEDNGGQYYIYTVIPEFPAWPLLLPMFITLITVIILIKKRAWKVFN